MENLVIISGHPALSRSVANHTIASEVPAFLNLCLKQLLANILAFFDARWHQKHS